MLFTVIYQNTPVTKVMCVSCCCVNGFPWTELEVSMGPFLWVFHNCPSQYIVVLFKIVNNTDLLTRHMPQLLYSAGMQSTHPLVSMMQAGIPVDVYFRHGEAHKIYGVDCLSVSIYSLLARFSPTYCPTLKNKPKVFFVQACMGGRQEEG